MEMTTEARFIKRKKLKPSDVFLSIAGGLLKNEFKEVVRVYNNAKLMNRGIFVGDGDSVSGCLVGTTEFGCIFRKNNQIIVLHQVAADYDPANMQNIGLQTKQDLQKQERLFTVSLVMEDQLNNYIDSLPDDNLNQNLKIVRLYPTCKLTPGYHYILARVTEEKLQYESDDEELLITKEIQYTDSFAKNRGLLPGYDCSSEAHTILKTFLLTGSSDIEVLEEQYLGLQKIVDTNPCGHYVIRGALNSAGVVGKNEHEKRIGFFSTTVFEDHFAYYQIAKVNKAQPKCIVINVTDLELEEAKTALEIQSKLKLVEVAQEQIVDIDVLHNSSTECGKRF